MAEPIKTKEPFRFYTRLVLSELTGLRAANLSQLRNLIKAVPDSCIYCHTHRFVQQVGLDPVMSQNDFAYWVTQFLGDEELGERLNSINIIGFSSISAIRDEILRIIEEHLEHDLLAKLRFAGKGAEFHFLKTVSFVLPTNYIVNNLKGFTDALAKVSEDSIYFHLFESRLRLSQQGNDFSRWLEKSLDNKELADKIASLDTYSYNMTELRKVLIKMLKKKETPSRWHMLTNMSR